MAVRSRARRPLVPPNVPIVAKPITPTIITTGESPPQLMNREWYRLFNDINDSVIDPIFSWLKAVDIATTTNLAATYDNGNSGVGATLTFSTSSHSIDSVTLNSASSGDDGLRVLVKNQTNNRENGIYTFIYRNDPVLILTRSNDYDNHDNIPQINRGDTVSITIGDINRRSVWSQFNFNTSSPALPVGSIGTTGISFIPYALPYLDTGSDLPDIEFDTPQLLGKLYIKEASPITDSTVYINANPNAVGGWVQLNSNTETIQDAIGTILTDTATIDFTYTDATPSIEASVKASSITNAMLAGSIDLTTKVTGTLPIANGGTGVTAIPSCSVYNNTAQTWTANAFTKIQFDSENFDTNGYFDSSTNYRFTPLIGGKYLVVWNATSTTTNVSATTQYWSALYKNGAAVRYSNYITPLVAAGASSTGHSIVTMNGSTDYLELFFANGHATNALTSNNNNLVTFMDITWVGP